MSAKPYSLRIHLLTLISVPIILAGMVIGGLAISFTYNEIYEVYDAQLVQAARLMQQLARHELAEHEKKSLDDDKAQPDFSHYYEKKISYRIWTAGQILTQSPHADVFGRTPDTPGFSTRDYAGTTWRIFVLADKPADSFVEVAENDDIRTELILQILTSLFIPSIIFVPLILIFVWVGATRSLKPMIELAREIDRRGVDSLAPLGTGRIPHEILPFIRALDRLFLRVSSAMQREREFTDSAAHELRTPLAAMKAQAQTLAKKTFSAPQYREDMENLLAAIDRGARMVDQLLTFARLQNQSEAVEDINFSALAETTLRDLAFHSLSKHQELDVNIEKDLMLSGSVAALGILVRNVVDNAIKYTPAGGHIAVRAWRENGKLVFLVADSGPGIPEHLRERVFDRFYRINKADGSGSGLGLAMVKWVTDMHRADIRLENVLPPGLTIRITFGSKELL